jgi:hypothetical protein
MLSTPPAPAPPKPFFTATRTTYVGKLAEVRKRTVKNETANRRVPVTGLRGKEVVKRGAGGEEGGGNTRTSIGSK